MNNVKHSGWTDHQEFMFKTGQSWETIQWPKEETVYYKTEFKSPEEAKKACESFNKIFKLEQGFIQSDKIVQVPRNEILKTISQERFGDLNAPIRERGKKKIENLLSKYCYKELIHLIQNGKEEKWETRKSERSVQIVSTDLFPSEQACLNWIKTINNPFDAPPKVIESRLSQGKYRAVFNVTNFSIGQEDTISAQRYCERICGPDIGVQLVDNKLRWELKNIIGSVRVQKIDWDAVEVPTAQLKKWALKQQRHEKLLKFLKEDYAQKNTLNLPIEFIPYIEDLDIVVSENKEGDFEIKYSVNIWLAKDNNFPKIPHIQTISKEAAKRLFAEAK